MRGALGRFWKLALALGVVGAIVSYTVPRVLDQGGEAVRGAIGSDAAIVATVRHPGEYQSLSFYSPMYLFPSVAPKDVPRDVRVGGEGPLFYAWARQNGAVPGQEQPFRLTLRGRDAEPVIIDAIRPRIVERGPPLAGWFTHNRGCDAVLVREAHIDLDRDPPTVVFSKSFEEGDAGREQLALTLQVSASDPEVIDVLAITKRFDVRWELEVLYSAAGDTGILVVRDGNKPFEATALHRGLARYYVGEYHGEQRPMRFVRYPGGDPRGEGMTFC